MKLSSTFSVSLVITFQIIISVCEAQVLEGRLLDEKTGNIVSFANIQIGSRYGTVSNMEGNFEIKVPQEMMADTLRISSMGYMTKKISIAEFKSGDIFISPKAVQLDAVFLNEEKLSARQVMDSVKKRLKINHSFSGVSFEVFKRSKGASTHHNMDWKVAKTKNLMDKKLIKKFNEKFDSILKENIGYTATVFETYAGKAGLIDSLKLNLSKASTLLGRSKGNAVDYDNFSLNILQELFREFDSTQTYHVRTGIIPLIDSLKVSKLSSNLELDKIDTLKTERVKKSLNLLINEVSFKDFEEAKKKHDAKKYLGTMPIGFINNPDTYEYTVEDITLLDDEYVYKISFKPLKNKAKYKGLFYISMDDYGIYRLEYQYAKGRHGRQINLGILGVRYKEKEDSGLITYQKEEAGYIPRYIRFSDQMAMFIDRNFVIKENAKGKRDKMKMKLDLMFDFDSFSQYEWLFSNIKSLSANEFDEFEENEGVPEEKENTYNAEMWNDQNSLAPTREILEFDDN